MKESCKSLPTLLQIYKFTTHEIWSRPVQVKECSEKAEVKGAPAAPAPAAASSKPPSASSTDGAKPPAKKPAAAKPPSKPAGGSVKPASAKGVSVVELKMIRMDLLLQ